ncbi:hypothetical protein T02_8149 [Trichinella nativa]|uniref:Uncharacterized protein n=1 Tax=Trichinella nativa TaxID=6335 RepID=A0A0V1KMI1_9BILA|nr:hypothetical protein T02_8149 [Trichinella nativa]
MNKQPSQHDQMQKSKHKSWKWKTCHFCLEQQQQHFLFFFAPFCPLSSKNLPHYLHTSNKKF